MLSTPFGNYEGEFEAGCKSGQGEMVYTSEMEGVYFGTWKDDRWHGKGRHTCPTGTYDGDFVQGKRSGQGRVEYPNGASYEGCFKDGRYSGIGTYTHPKSFEVKYEGEWEYGRRQGKGTISFLDGSKWEGQFQNNKMTGAGKITLPNGTVIHGKWKYGCRDGRITIISSTEPVTSVVVEKNREEIGNAEFLAPEPLPVLFTNHLIDNEYY